MDKAPNQRANVLLLRQPKSKPISPARSRSRDRFAGLKKRRRDYANRDRPPKGRDLVQQIWLAQLNCRMVGPLAL